MISYVWIFYLAAVKFAFSCHNERPMDTTFDRDHIWHPYTSAIDPLPCYPVVSCDGVRIHLESSESLIDGMSSWWAALHGYNHPVLVEAMINQIRKMSHVMFGGLTHEPAIDLCRKLLSITSNDFDRVFLSDSGSVAVEVALKMAMQYQQGVGKPLKRKMVALRGAYHGDTIGAMGVCDPDGGMHFLFKGLIPEAFFLRRPDCLPGEPLSAADQAAIDRLFTENGDEIAAVIVEPLVQNTGGMYFYDAAYLHALRKACDATGTLLIFDEIATGFGRLGKALFAYQEAEVQPDILCMGKAMTGGMLTLAATLCTDKVAKGICDSEAGVFMHGPTYMGNPLACATALASIELLLKNDWQTLVAQLNRGLSEGLAPCRSLPGVRDVRVYGGIGVVEMESPVDLAQMQAAFVEKGVWIRPFGRLVYLMPPYVINRVDLAMLTSAIVGVLQTVAEVPDNG